MITLIGYPSLRSEWFYLLQGNEVLSAPWTASGGYERVRWSDEHALCIGVPNKAICELYLRLYESAAIVNAFADIIGR